jgi:hypothetical protein
VVCAPTRRGSGGPSEYIPIPLGESANPQGRTKEKFHAFIDLKGEIQPSFTVTTKRIEKELSQSVIDSKGEAFLRGHMT